jgi:UDP-2,4-diacetamido-2,4,6-trideoxy-beta-L-altropyranose hydrolase
VVRCALDGERAAVISLALAPEHRGRGLGRRVIELATAAAFERWDVERVLAHTRPENVASQRAFAAAGYTPAGETVHAGVALVSFERLRGEGAGLLFRCDGSAGIGWGHVMRCLSLAAGLRAAGARCTFLMRDSPAALAERIRAGGHDLHRLPGDDDAAATIATLRDVGAGTLVLDSYALGREYLERVHAASGVSRIVIDDLADRALACDVVLNASPGGAASEYARWQARTLLLGPQYALLRPEFRPGARPAPARDEGEPLVLVTLGASELGARAVELAGALDACDRPLRIALLVGGSALSAARDLAASARHAVEVHHEVRDVAALLARTTLAVSAAGTTCYELAACGVPALLLVAAENQGRVARAWHEHGAFTLVGRLDDVAASELVRHVASALDDRAGRAASATRARALVDVDGARRAAAALLGRTALRDPAAARPRG